MALQSLHDVLVDNLKDLYNAEKQLIKAIPKLAKAATDERLREALEEHAQVTRGQYEKLEQVFESIGVPAKGKKCVGMEGIIEEGDEVLEHRKDSDESALDAAIIVAAQKAEHYEIGSYGSVRTFAEQLGYTEAAELLQEILDEESEANEKLNEIAQEINEMAAAAAEESEEEEDDDETQYASASSGRSSTSRGRSRSNASRR